MWERDTLVRQKNRIGWVTEDLESKSLQSGLSHFLTDPGCFRSRQARKNAVSKSHLLWVYTSPSFICLVLVVAQNGYLAPTLISLKSSLLAFFHHLSLWGLTHSPINYSLGRLKSKACMLQKAILLLVPSCPELVCICLPADTLGSGPHPQPWISQSPWLLYVCLFFLSVLLKYSWHKTLYMFKVYSIVI